MHHSHRNNRTHNIGYHHNLTDRPKTTIGLHTPHRHTDPAVKSEINLNINGLKNKLEELKLLIHDTHADFNTKHCTQNSNWVHNRHKHTTSTRRNTHTTHERTPPTTRITDKTKSQLPIHPLPYITTQQATPRRKKPQQPTTNTIPLTVHHSATTLPRATRRILTQLRTNECPILHSYLNKINHYTLFADRNQTQHTCSTALI